jgi:hypothetical protein
LSCDGPGEVSESGRWPCGVCRTGVGSNSVECTRCAKWVHKKCSDVKVSLEKVKTTFVCRRCLGSMKDDLIEKSVIIGKGVELEKVRKFCYLGDMLDADGGVQWSNCKIGGRGTLTLALQAVARLCCRGVFFTCTETLPA